MCTFIVPSRLTRSLKFNYSLNKYTYNFGRCRNRCFPMITVGKKDTTTNFITEDGQFGIIPAYIFYYIIEA